AVSASAPPPRRRILFVLEPIDDGEVQILGAATLEIGEAADLIGRGVPCLIDDRDLMDRARRCVGVRDAGSEQRGRGDRDECDEAPHRCTLATATSPTAHLVAPLDRVALQRVPLRRTWWLGPPAVYPTSAWSRVT